MSDERRIRLVEPTPGGPTHVFFCPACQHVHGIRVEPGGWKLTGTPERPTIDPSVKVETYEMNAEGWAMYERGERPAKDQRYPGRDTCCHSVVTDGMIEFKGDCTHGLANQTVELPVF